MQQQNYNLPVAVKTFLALVMVIQPFLISQSHSFPVIMDTSHIARWGTELHQPFSSILNLSTSLMYFGSKVVMVYNPQS